MAILFFYIDVLFPENFRKSDTKEVQKWYKKKLLLQLSAIAVSRCSSRQQTLLSKLKIKY